MRGLKRCGAWWTDHHARVVREAAPAMRGLKLISFQQINEPIISQRSRPGDAGIETWARLANLMDKFCCQRSRPGDAGIETCRGFWATVCHVREAAPAMRGLKHRRRGFLRRAVCGPGQRSRPGDAGIETR